MFFKQPELTSGSRPILQQDETLLFVQNGVGLYEGKYKIASCQNGHAYLTSHRACYIDDVDPRNNSLAIDLRDVERHEYQAGFLRSSPKITFHPKPLKRVVGTLRQQSPAPLAVHRLQSTGSSPVSRTGSPFRPPPVPVSTTPATVGTWVCPICSFNNPIPSNFDPATASESFPLPPCLTCGIQPPYAVVLKAAIAANATQAPSQRSQSGVAAHVQAVPNSHRAGDASIATSICPRCTFHNHPSLKYCEMCMASLQNSQAESFTASSAEAGRSQSPGPEISSLNIEDNQELPIVKISFRAGGDKAFNDKLKNAMVQRKWLVTNAPPVPRPLDHLRSSESSDGSPSRSSTPRPTGVGIAGLEQRGMQSRKTNEAVLGTAFEDLEALMASAREVVALAEKFSLESNGGLKDSLSADPVLFESAAAMGMVATKDMLSDSTNALYISELSRNLAEDLTDERRGILRKQGGVMSLVDLWASFNRSRNGVELISPSDFHKAAEMWSRLNLPVRLRQFKSGLLVVQQRDRTDDKTIAQLVKWLKATQDSHQTEVVWDAHEFGYGVTAQDAAQAFGWSLGVATEELEMAEEKGVLCREEGIQGLKFWLNYFIDT